MARQVPRPDRLAKLAVRREKQIKANKSWRDRNRDHVRQWGRDYYRRRREEPAADKSVAVAKKETTEATTIYAWAARSGGRVGARRGSAPAASRCALIRFKAQTEHKSKRKSTTNRAQIQMQKCAVLLRLQCVSGARGEHSRCAGALIGCSPARLFSRPVRTDGRPYPSRGYPSLRPAGIFAEASLLGFALLRRLHHGAPCFFHGDDKPFRTRSCGAPFVGQLIGGWQ